MSYRTYVEEVQIFGNNEYYEEWIEFIKSQGISINSDEYYQGNIRDFMGALSCIESIVLRINREREAFKKEWEEKGIRLRHPIQSYFDFTNIPSEVESQDPTDKYNNSLFDKLYDLLDNSYAFLPYTFFKACEDKLEQDHVFSTDGHFYCFKLKEGETIHVEAH